MPYLTTKSHIANVLIFRTIASGCANVQAKFFQSIEMNKMLLKDTLEDVIMVQVGNTVYLQDSNIDGTGVVVYANVRTITESKQWITVSIGREGY